MLILVGAIGFFIYKIITRRKQTKSEKDKKETELNQIDHDATVSVHESTFGEYKKIGFSTKICHPYALYDLTLYV